MRHLVLILGNQLFDPGIFARLHVKAEETVFFLREDRELASYYKFHKHKILFFFAAMRRYRDELKAAGYRVHYEEYSKAPQEPGASYQEALGAFIDKNKIKNVSFFEIEDKFFETRIQELLSKKNLSPQVWPSPMFLTPREVFADYLKRSKKPFMKTFYEQQRKRLNVLVDERGLPVGGAWSFDAENRLALPPGHRTPDLPQLRDDPTVAEVAKLVDEEFADHPGLSEDFWLPVDRSSARSWLKTFLEERLENFGPYEDAIPEHSQFVYHSVLTPFLNCGLLTPSEVVRQTLMAAQKKKIPLPSLEGFLRQVIGWREFVRGIYQNYSEKQDHSNFWNHTHKLSPLWYEGGTGVPPLDETLNRVRQFGYAHHIERLMVVGSLMLLLEVKPQEAHRWFMEMFIDSSDWVMGPNVYGMALFSDGGIFATKPYICGSNYLRKMGGYSKGEWCDGVDGLYWQFIRKHEKFFLKNPRLSMMARTSQKIEASRWKKLEAAADELRKKLVVV